MPCSCAAFDHFSSWHSLGSLGLDARLVAEQPEQGEVGVDLARHHRFEVELDKGLAGQAGVVAQDAQAQAVGDEPPEMLVGAVEELLDQAVRAGAVGPAAPGMRRSRSTWKPTRWIGVCCQLCEIAYDLPPISTGLAGTQPAVAELLEERKQPLLTGDGRAGSPGASLASADWKPAHTPTSGSRSG